MQRHLKAALAAVYVFAVIAGGLSGAATVVYGYGLATVWATHTFGGWGLLASVVAPFIAALSVAAYRDTLKGEGPF